MPKARQNASTRRTEAGGVLGGALGPAGGDAGQSSIAGFAVGELVGPGDGGLGVG